jgi:hypothetical protein
MESIIERTEKVQQFLKYTYGLVPIVAGADKFANLLTNWADYISPPVSNMLPFSAATFMILVGVIEIAAGILVLWRPRIGAWVVMGWLIAIGLSLVLTGHYDVAVRDFVMAVGAFALAKLTVNFEREETRIEKAYT